MEQVRCLSVRFSPFRRCQHDMPTLCRQRPHLADFSRWTCRRIEHAFKASICRLWHI
jgi:hypothetical protein